MYLGIEIGGTKLQLGVGAGDGSALVELTRLDVAPDQGASGVLNQIRRAAETLIARHGARAVGVGFGGPVDAARGRIVKSHQVSGWDDFALVDWCRETLDLPAVIANDADTAGLAEARFGAGREKNPVFYVTVGSGVGGGFLVDGRIYRGRGSAAAELGHLRPGLHADRAEETIESIASGWAIAARAQARLADPVSHRMKPLMSDSAPRDRQRMRERLIAAEEEAEEYAADLLSRADGAPEAITAKLVAQAAQDGNPLAMEILRDAWQALGWGVAQMITLLAPEVVVIGGGVSLIGEQLMFAPLREEVDRYVFPPLRGAFSIAPAVLGEEMVVHGALALAADASC